MKLTIANVNGGFIPTRRGRRAVRNTYNQLLSWKPDIITVQEHFYEASIKVFRRKISVPKKRLRTMANNMCEDAGLEHNHYFKDTLIGSGLLTNSRFEILEHEKILWKNSSKPFLSKGVGCTRFSINGQTVDVYNIHMPTGRNDNSERALKRTAALIKGRQRSAGHTIVSGDLNYGKNHDHLKAFLKRTGLRIVGYDTRIEFCCVSGKIGYIDFEMFGEFRKKPPWKMSKPFMRNYADHPLMVTYLEIPD